MKRIKTVFLQCKQTVCSYIQVHFAPPEARIRLLVSSLIGLLFLLIFLLGSYPIGYALFFAVLFGMILFLSLGTRRELLAWLLWGIGPLLSFMVVEYMIGNLVLFPFALETNTAKEILLNLVGYYMIAGVLYLLCGRRKLSAILSSVLFLIVALGESYFYAFRGRVLFPADLFAARTAMNVIAEYDFTPSVAQWLGTLVVAMYIVGVALMPRVKGRRMPKWFVTVSACALCVVYLVVFFCTPFLSWTGFEGKLWTSLWKTRQNGVLLNFAVNLRYSSVEKPDGYDDRLEELLAQEQSDPVQTEIVKPHIIAIMNEAFCDLSVIGVETNEECLPFLHSLTENTVKGYTYASVFAGHTANSEYEFLTGNSVSFLPVGTVAFQMFTGEGDYSLPGQMKDLGYHTVAMHPYDASGWNRVQVYARYRFDETYFLPDFREVINIRDYCSDRSNYENVISVFENHCATSDEPLFLFNVTMQNHGDYSVNWSGLERTVWMTGELEGKYESVDLYLSLARESDSAFAELISYFQTVDEPTAIVMFGDHQPGLGDRFYKALLGHKRDELSPEEALCLYRIPYVIWTNYDIEERQYEEFSLNYLSTVVTETLGLPMTGYQKFLARTMQVLPVLTRNFCWASDGNFCASASFLEGQAQTCWSEYSILQYNGVKGGPRRADSYFNLVP